MNDGADPLDDQILAAAHDAEDRFKAAVKALDGEYTEEQPGDIVAKLMADYMEKIKGETLIRCGHVPSSPTVLFGAASLPGVVGCAKCISQHLEWHIEVDQIENRGRTCNACGKKARMGKTGMIQNGLLLLTVSMCDSCVILDEISAEEKKRNN